MMGLWTPLVTRYFLLSLPGTIVAIFLGQSHLNHRLRGDSFLPPRLRRPDRHRARFSSPNHFQTLAAHNERPPPTVLRFFNRSRIP